MDGIIIVMYYEVGYVFSTTIVCSTTVSKGWATCR